jgi:hypothetical protein
MISTHDQSLGLDWDRHTPHAAGKIGERAEGHFNLTIVEMIDEIRTAELEYAKIDARRALADLLRCRRQRCRCQCCVVPHCDPESSRRSGRIECCGADRLR